MICKLKKGGEENMKTTDRTIIVTRRVCNFNILGLVENKLIHIIYTVTQ
jgi:hypothetical protein